MVFDLRAALLKKGEIESARLADFEFRLRARTMRLLAARLDRDPVPLVAQIAAEPDEAILAADPALAAHFAECREQAHAQLVAELGDPTPYKLA